MIEFFLGIIIGMFVASLVIGLTLAYRAPLDRTIRQLESKVKPKGMIIERESEELEQWTSEIER